LLVHDQLLGGHLLILVFKEVAVVVNRLIFTVVFLLTLLVLLFLQLKLIFRFNSHLKIRFLLPSKTIPLHFYLILVAFLLRPCLIPKDPKRCILQPQVLDLLLDPLAYFDTRCFIRFAGKRSFSVVEDPSQAIGGVGDTDS
jgi:hypothetical protein